MHQLRTFVNVDIFIIQSLIVLNAQVETQVFWQVCQSFRFIQYREWFWGRAVKLNVEDLNTNHLKPRNIFIPAIPKPNQYITIQVYEEIFSFGFFNNLTFCLTPSNITIKIKFQAQHCIHISLQWLSLLVIVDFSRILNQSYLQCSTHHQDLQDLFEILSSKSFLHLSHKCGVQIDHLWAYKSHHSGAHNSERSKPF